MTCLSQRMRKSGQKSHTTFETLYTARIILLRLQAKSKHPTPQTQMKYHEHRKKAMSHNTYWGAKLSILNNSFVTDQVVSVLGKWTTKNIQNIKRIWH